MKLNMIKALIKKTAESEIPNVIDKIDLTTIDIIQETMPIDSVKPHFNLTRVFQFAVLIFVLGFTSILVYALIINPSVTPLALETDEEVIGFQAISALAFTGSVESLSLSYLPLDAPVTTPNIADQITNLNTYINALETLIGDKDNITLETSESIRPEYAFFIHFEAINLLDQLVNYDIYFNKTQDLQNSNITHLEGILILSENEYALQGTITQTQSVKQISITAMIDQDNYVTIEDQSTESNQQYRYTVYENSVQTQQMVMGLTMSENRISAKVNYEQGGDTVQFQISKVEANSETAHIMVKYSCNNSNVDEEGDINVTVEYDETTLSYQYRFMVNYRHGNQSASSQYTGVRKGNSSEKGNGNDEDNGNGQGNGNHQDYQIQDDQYLLNCL